MEPAVARQSKAAMKPRVFHMLPVVVLCLAAGCNAWPMLEPSAVKHPIEAIGGAGVIYTPPASGELWTPAKLAAASPEELAYYYAPIYVQGHQVPGHGRFRWPVASDSIGQPFLVRRSDGSLTTEVDVSRPTVYVITERRALGTHEHVQLTYTLWFPEHPRTKALDIEAAHIDSGVVRITLDAQNAPLFYETVLACGCYHKVFMESRVEAAAAQYFGPPQRKKEYAVERNVLAKIDWEVAGLVDTPVEQPTRPVLFTSAGEHRWVGLYSSAHLRLPDDGRYVVPYRLADYGELQAVPVAGTGETGSIFNAADDQQVFGADRLERFIFMWIGTDDAGHPRRNDQILLHFDQSSWSDPTIYHRYLRLPPGIL